MNLSDIEIRLTKFFAQQIENSTTYFGYPEIPNNNDLSILGVSGLSKLHLNNAGDPYVQGNSKMHTKEFEQEVLSFVAQLYGVTNHWGYVTSGGTEGNLYGMYMGRDYFKAQGKQPFFLYAASSHYSIAKNAHLLGMAATPVAHNELGELDFSDLKEKVKDIISKDQDYGLVINLNIGTTMTGAIDDAAMLFELLNELGVCSDKVFVHVDAALMGFMYPFLPIQQDLFALGVKSIAMSGHKFPGTIHPCGIFLTDKKVHEQTFKSSSWVSYIGTSDTTISGSRNGFLALNLWYIIKRKGVEGFKNDTKTCIENATYLYQKLQDIGYTGLLYNQHQIIVVFDKPSQAIVEKYQLATQQDKAHVVVMQHITKAMIDEFVNELKSDQ